MKYYVHKGFFDFEREEKWLNEMSVKGLAMTDYYWYRYAFEQTAANEYTYRIEFLEHPPTHPESITYIKFLEDNGIECISSFKRWVYLRKKTSDGPFCLYTDIESKLIHYKRVNTLWLTLILIELFAGIPNLIIGIFNSYNNYSNYSTVNIIIGIELLGLALVFYIVSLPVRRKIRKLKKDRMLKE